MTGAPGATTAFIIIVALASGFFFYNASRLISYLRIGGPADRTNAPGVRVENLLRIGIGQSKIMRDPVAGAMHAAVFWGFIVLTAGTVELMVQGVWPQFSYGLLLARPLYTPYVVSQETFAIFVLGAVAWLFYRRLVIKPKRLRGDALEQMDALSILSMIALLLINASAVIAHPDQADPARMISRGIAGALGGMSPMTAATVVTVTWWLHVLLVLAFLNYLPYSKHLHVITSLPNVYLSNTSGPGQRGAMPAMDLEAEGVEQFGAADVDQLSWKNLLDGYSCTECGRCTAACPANITGKVLSPRKIVINVRERLLEKAPGVIGAAFDGMVETGTHLVHGEGENEPEGRLLDTFISEEELWACTSCRACVTECPVSIDPLDTINELRRHP